MNILNGVLATIGVLAVIALYVLQVVMIPRDDRVPEIFDEHGNNTGRRNGWHTKRFITTLSILFSVTVFLYAVPSANVWSSVVLTILVLALIVVSLLLTVALFPENEVGERVERLVYGPTVDPSDPGSDYVLPRSKRPAIRARFWLAIAIVGGAILAWIVVGAISLVMWGWNSTFGDMPEAKAPAPAVSTQAPAPAETTAAAPAPTTKAPATAAPTQKTEQVDASCDDVPELLVVNEISSLKVRDTRVLVCKDGKWVSWAAAGLPNVTDVSVTGRATVGEYKYFRIQLDGKSVYIRFSFTAPIQSPPATGA